MSGDEWLAAAVSEFGADVTAKFATGAGEAEDHLRAPVERLVKTAGVATGAGDVVLAGEDHLADVRVRPDFAVVVDGALVGHLEVKAPGKGADPSKYRTAHDREQWARLQSLPNVLYTDGCEWGVYRDGERDGELATLTGDVTQVGSAATVNDGRLATLLTTFLSWTPSPPRSPKALALTAARLCRLLRAEVAELLVDDQGLQTLARDWRDLLFPQATDEVFADGYAQTVTFALLLARVDGIDFADGDVTRIAQCLGQRHGLMGTALGLLTSPQLVNKLATSVRTLVRVLSEVDWDKVTKDNPESAWLLFYEDFLAEYDPKLRRESGSYYTPNEVVDTMVRLADELVRDRLDRPRGLAADDVTIVDPAAGTGTFLFRTIDRIARTIQDLEGPGAVPAQLQAAAKRLIGFELQTGPFSVAELRLNEEFRRRQASVPADDLRLYVANTLDNPYAGETQLGGLYEPIARSRRLANKVKAHERVLVVIGNPPYKERSKGTGGWVENGDPNRQGEGGAAAAPLADWIPPSDWGVGAHVKHLYNPYVYFWRWATWKVFDVHAETSGVVAFISVAGFLNGPGFAGMRDYLRRTCSEIWVIDLTPEGHQPPVPTRVFTGVQQPVCITIALRTKDVDPDRPAPVHYHQVQTGSRDDKFDELSGLALTPDDWQRCRDGWRDSFLPAGAEQWLSHPALEDLVPWSGSGFMPGRTWVTGPDPDTLQRRWETLITAATRERKAELLKEHTDRQIGTILQDNLYGWEPRPISLADEASPAPDPVPVAYRSFDRQWLLPDKRLINRPNPSLWYVRSDQQLFLTALNRTAPTSGPAVTFAALIPDLDHYKGSFGGRVFPLWRDPGGREPNIAPGLVSFLADQYGTTVSPQDLFAYLAAVLATPAYPRRFADDLAQPGLRVPLTADPDRFAEAVRLGRRVIWLHTYGQRCTDPDDQRPVGPPMAPADRRPRVDAAIPSAPDKMPTVIDHDPDTEQLLVGDGRIGPVPAAVWEYEISGTRVLRKWFGYRRADPEGRRSSDLDTIVPTSWPPAYTTQLLELLNILILLVDLQPAQQQTLDRVMSGTLITVEELTAAAVLPIPNAASSPPPVPPPGRLFE